MLRLEAGALDRIQLMWTRLPSHAKRPIVEQSP